MVRKLSYPQIRAEFELRAMETTTARVEHKPQTVSIAPVRASQGMTCLDRHPPILFQMPRLARAHHHGPPTAPIRVYQDPIY
ncbi:hypothetical protein N7468_007685 [Penicillium chermesinum]|uniref:Uncharacterized protein n=1 Tax=Penicillium chermesinum TaxID=63820 RepID=A0A9W9TME1_9EURO|nr:uncharacterized protein N7468_007685 [Penicillium chermesinum]KAJ5226460.1 hypothetical protein N7468_007685 [Penicillium chermesinum]